MMSHDPDQLIAEARAGSLAALDSLLERLSEHLLAGLKNCKLRGISPSRSGVDFVQDTLVRVREKFDQFPGESWDELTRWSWRILRRRHSETRRNRNTRTSEKMIWKIWSAVSAKRNLPDPARPRKPADELERREEAERAYALFKTALKPHERTIIHLRLVDGLAYEKIAQKVGLSGEAVRSACNRALDRLGRLLESDGKI